MSVKRHRSATGDLHTDFEQVKTLIEKRLFLGRLPVDTDEDELKLVYGDFGILTEVKKVPDKGMAFVAFQTWAAAHRALKATDGQVALRGHRDGQKLVASFAERTSSAGRGAGQHLAKGLDNTRVFVGGLPEDISEEDLRGLFGRFGELAGLNLLPAKSHRRCGFVNYSIWGEALDAVEQLDAQPYPGRSNGDGSVLTVVLAEPKPGQSFSGGGGKGGHGDYSGAIVEHSSAKRRRLDDYGSSDPTGKRAEFDRLKAEYITAVDSGIREDACTELHNRIMAVRNTLFGSSYVSGGSAMLPWNQNNFGGSSHRHPSAGDHRSGHGDPKSDSNAGRLFIGGLPNECTDNELLALVSQLTFRGSFQDTQILECRVLPGRGCGYLRMSSWAAAEEAKDALDNRSVTGWRLPLRAKWAESKGSDGPDYSRPPVHRSASSWSGHNDADHGGGGGRGGEVDRHRLFIGQLARGIRNEDVAGLFAPYGTVEECRMLQEKGVAYVTFAHTDQAKRAKEAMDGRSIPGVSRGEGLNVQFAKPR